MVKRQYLTTRVSDSIKREIRQIAKDEHRSVSQVVSLLISEALQARQEKAAA